MKKIIKKILTAILISLSLLWGGAVSHVFAQSTNRINYQAVARDAGGNPMAAATVTVSFSIHRGAAAGPVSMNETHVTTTNTFGLFNLIIGSANPAAFDTIAWGKNSYYLQVFVNSINMGTTQFISVPYALHAVTADSLKYSSGSNLWKRTTGNIYPYTLSDNLGIGTATPSGKLSSLVTSGNVDAFNVGHQGLGRAGVFSQSNAANDSSCLISYTAGKGDAVFGINMGIKGHGGVFVVNNSSSGGCGLVGSTNGKGKAVFGYQTGTGYGGVFWINNTLNDSSAVVGMTNGKGSAVWGLAGGIGSAGVFQSTNASSTAPGLNVSVANSAAPSAIFMGGNVGIGTSSPLNNLHVLNSSANPTFLLLETNTGCAFDIGFKLKTPCNEWILGKQTGGGDAADLFKIKHLTSGFIGFAMLPNKVGLGTNTPQAFFHVSPDKDFTYDSSFVVTSEGRVGVGTTTPAAKLEVAGQIKIVDGTQANGRVLTSDAGGLATWQNPPVMPMPGFSNMQVYPNAGTFTFTVPAGVTKIMVEVWGGGGGGGTNPNVAGGGAGGYGKQIISVAPSTNHTVIVGAGGGAQINGGSSSFDGATLSASGGAGATTNLGGVGGTSAAVFNINGGDGVPLLYTGGSGFSGGSAFGGSGGHGATNGIAATPGISPGGGGGGGCGTAGFMNGASGGTGRVVVYW